jgi:hypothetical protein
VIERTLRSTPSDATHWSIRSMAAAIGISHTTIRRIWTAFGLQPHRCETFKLSSDPSPLLSAPAAVLGSRRATAASGRARHRKVHGPRAGYNRTDPAMQIIYAEI